MTLEVGGMMAAGIAALVAGIILARPRFRAADGPGRAIILGPIFEGAALAVFAAEHLTAARTLAPAVPHWLPAPLFWTYFFGVCLLAAAVSLVIGTCVRWSAPLLALFFVLIVATIDLPNLPRHLHERLFWTLLFRETAFACGVLVLWGSLWRSGQPGGQTLVRIGRTLLAAIMVFYAVEHFLFPRFVIGVPLEKPIPSWVPVPALWAYLVGLTLLVGGIGLLFRSTTRLASAGAGLVLLLLTACFYVPMLVSEFHSAPVEGLNYVFDTLLFAGTVLLSGSAAEPVSAPSTVWKETRCEDTAASLP